MCLKWEKAARMAQGGTLTEVHSRKLISDILESTGQSPLESPSVRVFLDDWLKSKAATTAKATARRYGDVLKAFLTTLGDRAGMPLSGIVPRDVQAFRDKEIKEGKSNKTANMVVKTLRIALNSARKQGMLISNPAEAVDLLPDNSATRETFTREQLQSLLKQAPSEWRGMILLGACAGLRIQDAAHLTWANIDLARKVIHYHPQKSEKRAKHKELETPILPDLEKYLLELPVKSKRADSPLFPSLSKKKATGRSGLSNTFTRLIAEAGVDNMPASGERKGKGRIVYKLGFHSLRHTFISAMANSGVSEELRKKIVGHTSNVHDRYTHLEMETLRKALEGLPRYVTEQ